ncbi:MAG: hypothetical protein PHS38_13180, partial [Bacteroidales bacterium]|nr:hypothetical protein [Bacteroidales bacterium]
MKCSNTIGPVERQRKNAPPSGEAFLYENILKLLLVSEGNGIGSGINAFGNFGIGYRQGAAHV